MIFIRHNITDPYFNIAAEEYFLRKSDKEYFLLYINDPSVIIGKHQNAYAEINYPFIRSNNIKVVRRISGGGAVWHDTGNLNFACIRNGREGELVNFRRYMQPVLDFLIKLGLKAYFQGKNTIEANGYKISGNAEHVNKSRVLHHGTLLFNTDLKRLEESLRTDHCKYLDKSVKSVRADTTNIIDLLGFLMDMAEFSDALARHILADEPGGRISKIESFDFNEIKLLAENKYSTWDWNYGYSPPYEFCNKKIIAGSELVVFFQAEKARITRIKISGSLIETSLGKKIESALLGHKHEEKTIKGILEQFGLNNIYSSIGPAELLQIFF